MDATDTDTLSRAFAQLLVNAWPNVLAASDLSGSPSFISDWMQANWEMFVEAALPVGVFLEIYGEGADCNGASSRVWCPDARATHAVMVEPRDGSETLRDLLSGRDVSIGVDGFAVEEFVAIEGTWYARKPPFDCALIERDDGPVVFRNEDVVFALGKAMRG